MQQFPERLLRDGLRAVQGSLGSVVSLIAVLSSDMSERKKNMHQRYCSSKTKARVKT